MHSATHAFVSMHHYYSQDHKSLASGRTITKYVFLSISHGLRRSSQPQTRGNTYFHLSLERNMCSPHLSNSISPLPACKHTSPCTRFPWMLPRRPHASGSGMISGRATRNHLMKRSAFFSSDPFHIRTTYATVVRKSNSNDVHGACTRLDGTDAKAA